MNIGTMMPIAYLRKRLTFILSVNASKRRRKTDRYDDFRMLPDNTKRDIVFFGGKGYLPLFCSLTDTIPNKKMCFNSATVPRFDACTFRRFETTTRTNWHYECAKAILDGTIRI
jgi:hypothetical protein